MDYYKSDQLFSHFIVTIINHQFEPEEKANILAKRAWPQHLCYKEIRRDS